jgi:fermentation-respiration switch protein FrsA (DUF1100 family)
MKILSVIMGIAALYAAILAAGFFMQERLIFFPEKLPQDYKFRLSGDDRELFIRTSDNESINGILFKNTGQTGVILYFHGNAGSLAGWQDIWEDIRPTGFDLLIIDYRGYGKSTGKISENGLYLDAEASYNELLSAGYKENQIIIYGRSIGTGVAMECAVRKKPRALILESPFTSLVDLASQIYPFFFPSLILKYHFDNQAKASLLSVPVLILHGDADEIIDHSHSLKLYNQLKHDKEICIIRHGGHNDLNTFPEYRDTLKKFFGRLP